MTASWIEAVDNCSSFSKSAKEAVLPVEAEDRSGEEVDDTIELATLNAERQLNDELRGDVAEPAADEGVLSLSVTYSGDCWTETGRSESSANRCPCAQGWSERTPTARTQIGRDSWTGRNAFGTVGE